MNIPINEEAFLEQKESIQQPSNKETTAKDDYS